MRGLTSALLTIAGGLGLFFSIRHGVAFGIIPAGALLFAGWWTIEGKEVNDAHR